MTGLRVPWQICNVQAWLSKQRATMKVCTLIVCVCIATKGNAVCGAWGQAQGLCQRPDSYTYLICFTSSINFNISISGFSGGSSKDVICKTCKQAQHDNLLVSCPVCCCRDRIRLTSICLALYTNRPQIPQKGVHETMVQLHRQTHCWFAQNIKVHFWREGMHY